MRDINSRHHVSGADVNTTTTTVPTAYVSKHVMSTTSVYYYQHQQRTFSTLKARRLPRWSQLRYESIFRRTGTPGGTATLPGGAWKDWSPYPEPYPPSDGRSTNYQRSVPTRRMSADAAKYYNYESTMPTTLVATTIRVDPPSNGDSRRNSDPTGGSLEGLVTLSGAVSTVRRALHELSTFRTNATNECRRGQIQQLRYEHLPR
jgi:hypothetical protein